MKRNMWVVYVLVGILGLVSGCSREAEKDVVNIGAVLPLSGKAAQYGTWIQEGLELGRDEINAAGGINGKRLEIIYEDDMANPKSAASAMQKLVNIDKVPVVYGSWASSCVLAQAPIAQQSGTVLVGEAISPKIRNAGDYVFRMQPDARYYLRQLVPFIYKEIGSRTVSILYVNNDFGEDQAKVFTEEFVKLGGRVLSSESYSQEISDFRAQLLKIKGESPNAVFVPGYSELGLVLKQAREMGLHMQFVGSIPSENPDVIKTAGAAAENLIYPHHFNPESTDERVSYYQQIYQDRYGRSSEGFAALAYDGIRAIAKVMTEQGESSENIKAGLYGLVDFPGVTGTTTFDDHGDVIKPIVIKTVNGGQFEVYKGEM